MKKLDNLVALKGVDAAGGPKQLFVNDLPGLGGELLENLTGREAKTLGEVWEKVRRRARTRLLVDAGLRLADRLNWTPTVYQAEAPKRAKALDAAPAGSTSVGVQVFISDAARLDVTLEAVRFWVGAELVDAQVQVAFLDVLTGAPLRLLGSDGQPLAPKLLVARPGLNVVEIQGTLDAEYAQADFFVGLSRADDLALGDLALGGFELDQPSDVGLTAAALVGASLEPTATGAFAALALDLSVDCSLAKAIERKPTAWAAAWLYLLGAELLNEKIYSPRTNYWAAGNLAISEELRDSLDQQYQGALGRAVKRVDLSDLCADCQDLGGVTYELDQMP